MPSDKEIEAATKAYFVVNPYTHKEWDIVDGEIKIALMLMMQAALEAAEKVRNGKPCKCLTPHHYSCNAKEDK